MNRTDWMKESIRAGRPFHIRNQNPITNNALNIISATLLYSMVILLLSSPLFLPWYIWPLCSLLTGCCFFGHFILVIHECSHNMFIHTTDPKQAKRLNSLIGTLASIPFFTDYVRHWEVGHITHHLSPCEEHDPQNPDPLDGARLLKKIAIIWITPFGFLGANPSAQYEGRLKRTAIGLLTWVPLALFLWQIHWASLLMLHYAFCMLATLNLCKIAQEHGADLASEPDPLLRSRSYFYPLQTIFSPFNINYHYEHHANFHVPWYLLPKYHQALKKVIPLEVQPYYFHRDYLQQLLGKKELPPRHLLGIEDFRDHSERADPDEIPVPLLAAAAALSG